MVNFRTSLKDGEKWEFRVSKFLNYEGDDKFYFVKKLDEYTDLSESDKQKILTHQKTYGQTDLVRVTESGIDPTEVKWDNCKYLTYNLFVEHKDVYNDGKVNITGPWRSVEKKEKLWLHLRDRKFRHNEDAILYFFDPKKLVEFVEANKKSYRYTSVPNNVWKTWGYVVPEEEIKKICDRELKISDEDYERFFSEELSAASHQS